MAWRTWYDSGTRPRLFCLVLALLCCVAGFRSVESPPVVSAQQAPHPRIGTASDGYVGSAQCSSCHQAIYTGYLRTKMGRSMEAVTPETIAGMSLPASVYSEKLDRHFDVFTRDGKLYQSEWQSDPGGNEVFRNTRQMDWIIGAGANGFGTLLRKDNFIFEAPLSFYNKAGTWELSPGYESRDLGFNRPIQADCINCHSGRPKPLDADSGAFESTPFEQSAIGCENCHGPGAAHIAAMRAHPKGEANAMIANPDEMSAPLVNDLCMSCHEGGDSRVPKPGKTYADFRPGSHLDDTLSIFMAPMRKDNPLDTEHVQHYLQMSMSKCFRTSAGRMSCTTCHDPHVEPTHDEAPAYFNARCAVCHTDSHSPCTALPAARQAAVPANNCVGCHMPAKTSTESAHTALTNHRILARPGEPWPDEAFQGSQPPFTELVHLDRVAGNNDPPPATTLLAAYAEVMQRRPEYEAAYLKLLAEVERGDPQDAGVQRSLGLRDLLKRSPETAIEHLRRSIALEPKNAQTYAYLSEGYRRLARPEDATGAIQTAFQLAPYNQPIQRTLVSSLLAQKRFKDAYVAAQHYIQTFPEDRMMPKVLAQIRAAE